MKKRSSVNVGACILCTVSCSNFQKCPLKNYLSFIHFYFIYYLTWRVKGNTTIRMHCGMKLQLPTTLFT